MDEMPSHSAVYRWLQEHEPFREQYRVAREAQVEALVDDLIYIADTEQDPAKARNRIAARQWLAAKLLPKKYGDNATIQHEHSGSVDLVGRLAAGRQRIAQIQRVEPRQIECVVEAEVIEE